MTAEGVASGAGRDSTEATSNDINVASTGVEEGEDEKTWNDEQEGSKNKYWQEE